MTKLYLLLFITVVAAQPENYTVDALVHPKRTELLVTVGADADINGFTSDAIQKAADIITLNGGGTVQLSKGQFDIIGPILLSSNTTLKGMGAETILKKCNGVASPFIIDADYGELKITVEDASGFKKGMGIQVYDDSNQGGWAVTTAKITDIVENTLYIDTYLVRDYSADRNGMVLNSCSIIAAYETNNVRIADLVVDGNKTTNEYLNGCRGGAIYIHKSTNAVVENVHVKDFAGDGISWQLTEDVIVRNNEISGCTNSGLHPGTGSPRTIIDGNDSHHNGTEGLFICWRVHHSIVKNNKFHHNGRYGICTGHKDTDVLFENNRIYENDSDGVNFRREKASNAPHRNTFINNIVENNGQKSGGYGFSFNSPAQDVLLKNNIIRDTGAGTQQAPVFIYKNGLPVNLQDNDMSGHSLGNTILQE